MPYDLAEQIKAVDRAADGLTADSDALLAARRTLVRIQEARTAPGMTAAGVHIWFDALDAARAQKASAP